MSNWRVVERDTVERWFHRARPGQRFLYFQGYLARDVGRSKTIRDTAKYVATLEEKGKVALVQKRLAEEVYEYYVVKLEESHYGNGKTRPRAA